MFHGLSAFPLTPLRENQLDESAYCTIVGRLVDAGVDSIGALGSTGSAVYLDRDERRRVIAATVANSGGVPVIAGIGALRTAQVQALAEDAQETGAAGVLLAPVSYQELTDDDVFGLYQDVVAELSLPLVVYDNPVTTRFSFSIDLYARIAALPNVAAIKIPPVPLDLSRARERVEAIRQAIPDGVCLGISGDSAGAVGLGAGCEVWFSAIGGTLPHPVLSITRAAQAGDQDTAVAESTRLQPLWDLIGVHGSLRVAAALAEHLGLAAASCLPRPILGLDDATRAQVAQIADTLRLE